MKIDDKLMKHIFKLAKIEYSEEFSDSFKDDFEKILNYMEILKNLDLNEITPMSHSIEDNNVTRKDVVSKSFGEDEILKNAPRKKNGYFVVPKTIE